MAKELKKKVSTKLLIKKLKKKAKETGQNFWKDIAERLERPRRIQSRVNIEKIEKMRHKFGDKIFLVPGKVLAKGELTKPCKIVAFSFSEAALNKIKASKGKAIMLKEFVEEKKVKGSDILIIQ